MNEGKITLEELRKIVEERGLTPCHAFFATFLAAFNEVGILTPGTVKFVTERAADVLYEYMKAMGYVKEGMTPEQLVDSVLRALDWGEWSVEREDSELHVKVVTSKCRYCPKGVGRAMLPATVCPLPGLLEEMLKRAGHEARVESEKEGKGLRLVRKEDDTCHIILLLA